MTPTPSENGDDGSDDKDKGESNNTNPSTFPTNKVLDRIANFKFESYNPAKDSWKFYIQRFELEINLLQLNTPALQSFCRDLLLRSVGSDLYRIVLEHYDPTPVSSISYAELTSFLASHNTKPVSYIIARCAFSQCVREPSMSIAEFVAKLRSLAPDCQFGKTLDERIRDQFLIGVKNPPMLERISELHSSPTDKLVDIVNSALNIEAAQNQRAAFESVNSQAPTLPSFQPSEPEVNLVQSVRQNNNQQRNNSASSKNNSSHLPSATNKQPNGNANKGEQNGNNNPTLSNGDENSNVNYLNPSQHCLRCGGNRHAKASDCKAIKATCRACQKVGHYDRACVSSGRAIITNSNNSVNYVSQFAAPLYEDYDRYLNYIPECQRQPPSDDYDYRHLY